MFSHLVKIKETVLDILFPPICLHCQQYLEAENYLCKNCFDLIQINTSLFCPVCRLRLAENKKICRHANYLLGAAGNYDNPILHDLIHYFKYKYFENLAPVLTEIILKYLNYLLDEKQQFIIGNSKFGIKNFVVVPIPLHHRKEKERGFNQSKLLAEHIARHFNLKLLDILKRTKNTKPQAQCKNSEERLENIKDCFVIAESLTLDKRVRDEIKVKNILLVDDVFTSGATMNEAVKILKQNGARRIIVLVLAKA